MNRDDTLAADGDRDPESFIERWSRRKREARDAECLGGADGAPPAGQPASDASVAEMAADSPAPPLPDVELLDQDSDYRAFLAPGVDAELRRRALRKLFRGPKFNVLDGLDIYQDDFRSFEPLGGIVTADMRHQIEAAARHVAASVEDSRTDPPPATVPAAVTAAGSERADGPAMAGPKEDPDEDRRDS